MKSDRYEEGGEEGAKPKLVWRGGGSRTRDRMGPLIQTAADN